MPLTEFLGMSKEKVDATQERAFSSDPSFRPDADFVELVWENGQILMQGQSSRARKNPVSDDIQTLVPRPQYGRNVNGSKMKKFSTLDHSLGDFRLSVPSCETGLDQDVEMVPWLNYAVEEPLHNDYACDFFSELSGVTINDLSAENQLALREKRSGFHNDGHEDSVNLKHGDTLKASSSAEKHTRGESREVPQYPIPFEHNVLRSGISDITGENVGNAHHVASRDFTNNPSSLSAFSSLRLQKLDAGQPTTSSGFTNFPYFSRPASLARVNHPAVNTSRSSNPADSTLVNLAFGCSQKEIVSLNKSAPPLVNRNSELLPAKPTEELHSANQVMCGEDVAMNDVSKNQASDAALSKVGTGAERNIEPARATSSVCSGSSVERASNEHANNLKRKSRETGESEDPSEEVEGESLGTKRVGHARTGSKRSRAAEVHNLSERRRRDRINEKMRALQELIPNCNKVDKASMLDEAIEYLKTLQLQVQMLSMGAGMYMHPMMLPPGMQPIHGAHMSHFSPLGLGMGMGMGFGMNMLDMNSGMKMLPFQGSHYPGTGPTFHGMPGSALQAFGHPGQGLPVSMQRPPLLPMSGGPPLKMSMGLNVSGVPASTDAPNVAPSRTSVQGVITSNNVNSTFNHASNQVSDKGAQQSVLSHKQAQTVSALGNNVTANGTDSMRS